jgi:S1-C subfamily serine protease
MDTAGSSVSFAQQATTAGFAIPIDTALAVARQIAAGHASNIITIGYPPFLGIFLGSGTSGSPQAQAQQQEQQNGLGGFNGSGGQFGSPSSPSCYTSNTSLAVPSSIAPVSSGALIDGTICGSPAAAAGLTGGSVITAVNGKPAVSPAAVTAILARLRPGDTITVSWVSPSGRHATSSLRLLAGPPQ